MKLRESLIKSLKITVKKIVKSTLAVPENYSLEKFFLKEKNFAKNDLHTPRPVQLAQITTTTSLLFSTIGW